jgi:Na+-driven multidrug efflux pump
MPIMGIGQGAQPIIGYNYGAKRYDRVKRCFKLALAACAAMLFSGFLVAQLAPGFCFSLFSKDGGTLRESSILTMRICTSMFPFIAFQVMGGQLFQAIGKPIQASVLSLSRQILFFIPSILFLPLLFEEIGLNPIYGVYCAFPLSDICSSMISFAFIRGEFKRMKTPLLISASK